MNDALKNEIFSLIEAPELREYLLSLPEDLNGKQYEQIIVGAPVGLKKAETVASVENGNILFARNIAKF